MTRALSSDLRQRAIAAVASGMTRRATAERLGIERHPVGHRVARDLVRGPARA